MDRGSAPAPPTDVRLVAALLALLALPFDPGWIDFETARRGVLLAVAGGLALTSTRWRPARLPAGALPLGLLCGLLLLRSIGVLNGLEALLRAAHMVALAVLFAWGSRGTPRDVLRALVPVAVVVAAYGTAQALGFDWPPGYTRPAEPVSTLGNRNVASEFASLALAGAAVLVATRPRIAVALAAAMPVALYVGLDGSRAGLLAAAAALGAAALGATGARARLVGLGALAALVAIGSAVRPAEPAEPPVHDGSASVPAPSTVDVRLEIWRAGLAMVADAPLLGHGTGQFRYAYPEYRTQREIELSSFGRRFPTFAESAHDDPLELAVEVGLPGLLLAGWFVAAVVRARLRRGDGVRRAVAELAPLWAFGVAALVRSPLGNAPVAAALFIWLGAVAGGPGGTALSRPLRAVGSIALGVLSCTAGVAVVGAASAAARWLGGGASVWIDRAVALHGSESRYRSLRIQDRCGGLDAAGLLRRRGPAELAACRDDVAALARLDPNNTNALFLAAQLAHGGGDRDAARAALGRILTLDPREPRAQLLAALLLAETGDAAAAAATLFAAPHPVLRARLAPTLAAFATIPALDAGGRSVLEREAAFVRAIDAVRDGPGTEAATAAVRAFVALAGADDHRVRVLLARQLQARGSADSAAGLAPPKLDVGSAIRALLAEELHALRALPAWQRAIDA